MSDADADVDEWVAYYRSKSALPMLDVDDTIVAIATARAGAIRGIVRVTGPRTVETLSTVVRCKEDWESLRAARPGVISGHLSAGEMIGEIPCDLYLWPSGRSYTRQPAAELHTLGSPPVLDAVLATLCQAGARLAGPGEFTLRAFLAGRLDLTQAEAVLGVIDAKNQTELHIALMQLAGGLAGPLHALREQLLDLLAHLEAGLDFVEEDIQFISSAELDLQLRIAADAVQKLLDQIGMRTETSGDPRVVLRGLPNVGKSSLFNALAGSESSIVSDVAATTRDYVCARVHGSGRTVLLIDTAGVEADSTLTGISGAAQRMTSSQSQHATLELFCIDATRPLTSWERLEIAQSSGPPRIVVLTKCDEPIRTDWEGPSLATSSRSGNGLPALRHAIDERLDHLLNTESAVVGSTAVRCVESLRRGAEGLTRARDLVRGERGEEFVAAEVRGVLDELGTVVGAVYTDDILDRVFSRFCIGK